MRRRPRSSELLGSKSPLPERGKNQVFSGADPGHPVPKRERLGRTRFGERRPLVRLEVPPELRSFGGFLPLPSCVILSQSLGKLFPARIYEPGACLGRETERAADGVHRTRTVWCSVGLSVAWRSTLQAADRPTLHQTIRVRCTSSAWLGAASACLLPGGPPLAQELRGVSPPSLL